MLNGPKIEKKLARALAKQFKKEIAYQFDRKVDPSGKKWPRTKEGEPFDKYGTVAKSIKVDVSGNEINITSSLPYTGYLNYGTSNEIPPRKIWPEEKAYSSKKTIKDIIDEIMMKELEDM